MQVTVVAALVCFFTTGCGSYRTYTSRSPDGRATVTVSEPGMIWSGVRVVLNQDGKDSELYSLSGDRMFTLAEVYWSPDQRIVGVFTCGEPILELAVDRTNLTSVPFSLVSRGPLFANN